MISLIYKRVPLESQKRSFGDIAMPMDKLFLLAAMHHIKHRAELLIDWEDQYIHLEMGSQVVHAAYAKADEFQFGRLLSQMASVKQEEIDEAYRKIKSQMKAEVVTSETGVTQLPPTKRIGSLLVAAHLISPHMIGTVLRTQVMERALRMINLESCHYTFEPKEAEEGVVPGIEYPYLDPSVGTDELIFHALLWRSPIKAVQSLLEFVAQGKPTLNLPSDFQLPKPLSVVCRTEAEELDANWLAPFKGRTSKLDEWLRRDVSQEAFKVRLTAAFLLTYANLWTVGEIKKMPEQSMSEAHVEKEAGLEENTLVTKIPDIDAEEAGGVAEAAPEEAPEEE